MVLLRLSYSVAIPARFVGKGFAQSKCTDGNGGKAQRNVREAADVHDSDVNNGTDVR